MAKRSTQFIEVAFFLSKYGQKTPPEVLQTDSWREAYHMFYEQLNEGRTISVFEHSLKNARDDFDSHFPDTQREGWKDKDGNPSKLSGMSLEVFEQFNKLSFEQIWAKVQNYANLDVRTFEQVFENLIAIEESEKEEHSTKTEGGLKVYISKRVERNPSLRNAALKIHGYDCMVCGFNFEKAYGEWGKDWAEVHHLTPMYETKKSKIQTDPKKDLAVVCANCHRMIHRKKGIVLTIDKLKIKIKL